jgi:hypothetical protein
MIIMSLIEFLKKAVDQLLFLFRIARRYNLKINPKHSYFKRKAGSDMRYDIQPIEQLSPPIMWQKKWEGIAKSLILKDAIGYSLLNPISKRYSVTRYGQLLDDTANYFVYQQKERLE